MKYMYIEYAFIMFHGYEDINDHGISQNGV